MDLPKSLAHYEISSLLGKGGMGEVVRARDSRLGREVALKLLPLEFADNPERLARFEREARTLALLQHPNVAAVYGFERDAGRLFLVMELVEGEDLARRTNRGPLPVEEAVAVAAQIAAGLEEAHERGIVHRDLKPGNVMLTPDGRVKILDFGLARAFLGDGTGEDDVSNSPTMTAAMTGAGAILGTAAYMSPEQARGKPVDRRADIWALGVILFEMLTGRRLFAGETTSDTLAAVLRQDVDLAALPAQTPPAVRRLLARCLDRDPKQRLRDAGEARVALENPAVLAQAEAAASAPRGGRTALWAAAVAVVGLAAAGAGWQLRPLPEPPLRKLELNTGPGRALTDRESGLVISPDGLWVAYSSNGSLWIRRLADSQAREVTGSAGVNVIFWSPDSAWVGFAVEQELWKVPAGGGQRLRICELPARPGLAAGAAWLEDGRICLTTGNTGLHMVPATGGKAEEIIAMDLAVEQDLHNVTTMPGDGVLYVQHRIDGINGLGVWRDGRRTEILHLPGEYLKRPAWSPSGHILYCQGENAADLWALPFDARSLKATGEPFFVAPMADVPSVSDDGTLVYLAGGTEAGDEDLLLVDREGRTVKQLGHRPSLWPFPALAPDLDFGVCAAREGGAWDLWVFDDRGGAVRLTDDAREEDSPILSPDGRWVYFGAGNAGDWRILRRAVDGTGGEDVILAGGALPPEYSAASPWLSADGRLLLYAARSAPQQVDIAMVRLGPDGLPAGPPEAVIATPAGERGAALSPDGKFIAYMSDVTGRNEVYVAQFPSGAGRRQVSVDGGTWPRWRSDGHELFYVAVDSLAAVEIAPGERMLLGTPRNLFAFPGTNKSLFTGLTDSYDVTPDGQKFLVTRWSENGGAVTEPAHIVVVDNWIREFR